MSMSDPILGHDSIPNGQNGVEDVDASKGQILSLVGDSR